MPHYARLTHPRATKGFVFSGVDDSVRRAGGVAPVFYQKILFFFYINDNNKKRRFLDGKIKQINKYRKLGVNTASSPFMILWWHCGSNLL